MAQRVRTTRQDRPLLFIDPATEYVTVGKLRLFTRKTLKELRNPVVVTGTSRPMAIILSYGQYLEFQEKWIEATRMVEKFGDRFMQMASQGGPSEP